jgi:hypothetical protein
VLQLWEEQVEQLLDDEPVRSLPPPIPKAENSFLMSLLPQSAQQTELSLPIETSVSKQYPHFEHLNSYIGIIKLSLLNK